MSRASAPVVGVVVLVSLTVLLSATVLAGLPDSTSASPPTASLSLTVDGSADRIELTHRGGDELDVSEMDVRISVDGNALTHQPPVPFFAADGFKSGPDGAFNNASSNTFSAGERTTLTLASTNHPQLDAGVDVSVQITTHNSVVFDETRTVS